MTKENAYSKEYIDLMSKGIHEKLDTVIELVEFTNGKVRKITLALAVIFGILLAAGSQYVPLLMGLLL